MGRDLGLGLRIASRPMDQDNMKQAASTNTTTKARRRLLHFSTYVNTYGSKLSSAKVHRWRRVVGRSYGCPTRAM